MSKDDRNYQSVSSGEDEVVLGSCDLCTTVVADPVDMERNGARLLSVRIRVNNVCYNKRVCVACIIYDQSRRIVAFRGFTTIVCKDNECGSNAGGTIERKLVFVLPDNDRCDPVELEIRTAANYIFPCESNN